MTLICRVVLLFVALTLMAPHCRAGTSLGVAVDSAYAHGQYERVELIVLREARHIDSLAVEERSAIYLKAGYSMIMLDRESDARGYFLKVLDADPTTHLDPVRVSPKFRVIFDDVKATYRPHTAEPTMTMRTQQPPPHDARSHVVNLLVPGSGQWREGYHSRGIMALGLQLVTVGAFVWQWERYRESRDDYLTTTDRAAVSSAYDAYRRDYQRAWALGITAGAIYLASQVDLALLPARADRREDMSGSISYAPLTDGGGVSWVIRW